MGSALLRTFTEILDSKKWIGSYVAAIGAAILHVYFGVSIENSLLLMSPIGVGILGQSHVDAAAAKGNAPSQVVTGQVIEQPSPPVPS